MPQPSPETAFDAALRRYLADPLAALQPGNDLLDELILAWNNPWSGQREFLSACLEEVAQAQGPILECGSGLSTVLAGALAQQRGVALWSLEHHPGFAQKTIAPIRSHRIKGTTLLLLQLQAHADFDWYRVPPRTLPEGFRLVICDGPPGTTRGGRFGLLPCMGERLAPGCVILLDDGDRPMEQAIARAWQARLGGSCELRGIQKAYFRLRAAD